MLPAWSPPRTRSRFAVISRVNPLLRGGGSANFAFKAAQEHRANLPVATLPALAYHGAPRPARRDRAHAEPLAQPAARHAARDVAPDADDPPLRGTRLGRLSGR